MRIFFTSMAESEKLISRHQDDHQRMLLLHLMSRMRPMQPFVDATITNLMGTILEWNLQKEVVELIVWRDEIEIVAVVVDDAVNGESMSPSYHDLQVGKTSKTS